MKKIIYIICILVSVFITYFYNDEFESVSYMDSSYNGEDYKILNDNIPEFDDLAKTTVSFEVYSELDSLGRCREAYANIGKDLMPIEDRKSIGMVKPTG